MVNQNIFDIKGLWYKRHVHSDIDKKQSQESTMRHTLLKNTELLFSILSGVFWICGLAVYFSKIEPILIHKIIFGLGIIFGGYYTSIEASNAILKGKLEIDFLMLFAAIGAIILGKWGDAGLLLFLFSLGHALEHYAMNRARSSITALANLVSHKALVYRNKVIKEVDVEHLVIGDTIVVKPNTKIPADGIVTRGHSNVDQSPITGESIPVGKYEYKNGIDNKDFSAIPIEQKVFAGTINGSGVIEVNVRKLSTDSTLARLITMVKEAEKLKSPTQHLADKFEKYYVPLVLICVILLLFAFLIIDETFQQSFYRAMAVLIAASPCALAISTPSAVLAAIARAARQGVLIKGGKPLEDLGKVTAIAFDKTGTLTEGKPKLTYVIPFENQSKQELLSTAIAVESLSDHPLARAIVKGAKEQIQDLNIPKADHLEALIARGVRAEIQGKIVHIGNRRLLEEISSSSIPKEIDDAMHQIEGKGNTAMIVHMDQKYLGVIGVMDTARKSAISTIKKLKELGIVKILMLTGDNQKVANAIASKIGISDPKGNLLPEDKVKSIETLSDANWKVVMVGDGVNDAPAMARSTVGIAMGAAGSDVALETADIALMGDKLENLPFAIGLSRKAKTIIRQNLVVSLGMVILLVPLTLFDMLNIGPAVIGHEGSTLLVVLNALRLLRFKID